MIRGTTPLLEFTLPFETSLLAQAWITLSQNETEILTKDLEVCSCDGCKLSVKLTQEDTLLLDCECNTEIQVRVKTLEGEALASDILVVGTDRILKDGVI